ncbi:hypothetical protein C5N14_20025 [Micromonospora sp. MW-13]|uniref:alpha/beta hydrolase n=1 Tax=Micromonospora sp. MW-13 TaxID=2094022 RepID=UPI000E44EDA2|nr:alpha/beta hydrolase [Micromonospora sp. MW-13]RGC67162.1 hypothetical protein C5N14_20025 [Micromonospora sp. MW-13]
MAAPIEQRPFVLSPPLAPVERHGRVDLHLPAADTPRPAVVLVHGAPLPPDSGDPRDWLLYCGYGALLAEQGLVAAVVSYRVDDLADVPVAADQIAAAVEQVRADPRVDADRLVLWFFSGGGLLSADWLRATPPWLCGLVCTYPLLTPPQEWPIDDRFHPVDALDSTGDLPIVLTRAGLDMPMVQVGIDAFVAKAADLGRPVQIIDVPNGRHGFDVLDHTDESRDAVRTARDAVLRLLTP